MESAWDILNNDVDDDHDSSLQPASFDAQNFRNSFNTEQNLNTISTPSSFTPYFSNSSTSFVSEAKASPQIYSKLINRGYEIKFHKNHIDKFLSRDHFVYNVGDYVIVEADQGIDMGQIINYVNPSTIQHGKIKFILRAASSHEIASIPSKIEKESNALQICQAKVNEIHLPMVITDTEFQFDGRKLTVYFSASTYVDFRQLVHLLFKIFSCRIWMVWYENHSPVRDVFTHNTNQISYKLEN